MRICILCEESKVSQAREKMKNDNILNIDLSPTGELPATHKMCVLAVTEEKAKQMIDSAELTIIEAMNPKEFLEKHGLKELASTDLQTYKIVKGFITSLEREEIIRWVDSIDFEQNITNHHIKEVRKNLNGNSYMFDISKTKNSEFISKFQSSGNIVNQDPPNIIYNLIDRISETIKLPKDDIILQVIDMNSGGKVNPHYDSAIDGHINYKCNISVMSDSYNFYVDKEIIEVNEGDLYCFEASLYKHWSDVFLYKRILLRFGFIISYNVTGRNENDPRVRLSQRIQKYFQQL